MWNGTRIPLTPGCSQRIAQQRDSVNGDGDEPGECVCSWRALSLRPTPGRRRTLPAIVEPDRHGRGDEDQGYDARGA